MVSRKQMKKKIAPRYSEILIHVYWIVHYSPNPPPPPLKTFTIHLHNDYLIKIHVIASIIFNYQQQHFDDIRDFFNS